MRAVDTNVLIYAHREEAAKHPAAVSLLRELSTGDTPWGVPVFCVGEFLRVVTHHRVFDPPTPLEMALDAVETLLRSPSVRLLLPGERFWPIFARVVQQGRATGNLIFDALIAALCLEHGVDTLISEDRDFARFEGLEVAPI